MTKPKDKLCRDCADFEEVEGESWEGKCKRLSIGRNKNTVACRHHSKPTKGDQEGC